MLISNAYAQSAPAADTGPFGQPVFMLIMFGIVGFMFFTTFRQQQKRAKETKQMLEALKVGDEIITTGGILGKIVKISEQYITVETGMAGTTAVESIVQKSAIQSVLVKDTIRSLQKN